LHQRVGRLNRYGQSKQVEVVSWRNPETVESLIWDRLNTKIENVMLALSQVMDEPEDLLQLVLGISSPSFFRQLFAEAQAVPHSSLSGWFDQKTARFGGKEALETVRDLVGNSVRFDFDQVANQLPQVDLPALRPFIVGMLLLNNRRVQEDDEGLSFITPEQWLDEPGIRERYSRMIFDRQDRSKDAAQRVLGVGHKLVNQALRQARSSPACVTAISVRVLKKPIFVYRIYDRVTVESGAARSVIVGIELDLEDEQKDKLFRDWELLQSLNSLVGDRSARRTKATSMDNTQAVHQAAERARLFLQQKLEELKLPFQVPDIEPIAMIWPDAR
jgi:hypothetical protein